MNPRFRELGKRATEGMDSLTLSVFLQGIVEFYHPAQIDVLQRVNAILERDAPSA